MLLEEFIRTSEEVYRFEELFDLLQLTVKKRYGADQVIYSFLTEFPQNGHDARHAVMTSYDLGWIERYTEQGYEKIDPVRKNAVLIRKPFFWQDVTHRYDRKSPEKRFMCEAEEAGLHNGVGIPLHGEYGELAGACIAFSDKTEKLNSEKEFSSLRFFFEQFHSRYCELYRRPENKPSLTKREIEALQWLAIGKSAYEISVIFACSEANIKFHMQNIYKKLNANSKSLAVVKAIKWRLITLDEIKLN